MRVGNLKLEEIQNMTVKEVLEEYCVLYSAECEWIYGIISYTDAENLWKEYELDDEPSCCTRPLINFEVLEVINETDDETLNKERIERIMDNLGIEKRGEETNQ